MASVPAPSALSAEPSLTSSSGLDPNLDPDNAKALPAFPLDRLPEEWARWIACSASLAGAPEDYAALGLLAAIAGATGAGVAAEPVPGWREPLVLWQCTVGSSGLGKSAALAAGRRLIDGLDDADDETVPQRVASESTLRALAGVVSRNPNGVVVWRDELLAWLPGRGRSRAGWQEAWSAQPIVVERGAKAARLKLERFPVSVIGGIRPKGLARALKGGDDGLASRFLYAWPARPPWRPFAERREADDAAALARLRRLAGCAGSAAEPRVLAFDKRAAARFEAFCKHWHEHAPDDDSPMAEWLAKAGSQVARLTGALALLEWSAQEERVAPPTTIGRETVEHAIALWDGYFRPHAEAVFRLVLRGPDGVLRRVVRWLKEKGVTSVSREDIRAVALARSVDARGANEVIARLEEAGVLAREATVRRRSRGGPRPVRWRVAAHLCQNVTANSDDPNDPDRFRKPPPPGFSLYDLHKQMKEERAAEAEVHLGENVTANSEKSEAPAPAAAQEPPAQPPPPKSSSGTSQKPAPSPRKNDNYWACYWPNGMPPRGSLLSGSGDLWNPDEALANETSRARRSG